MLRYINHSFDPTAAVEFDENDGKRVLRLKAIKDIKGGDVAILKGAFARVTDSPVPVLNPSK